VSKDLTPGQRRDLVEQADEHYHSLTMLHQLVTDMHAEGVSVSAMARACGVSRQTVYNWMRYHERDMAELERNMARLSLRVD
jgi:transposase